jgi:arsenate reductase-like glutaredoxin family protein
MITIYHNPRCTKSGEGLHSIEKSKKTTLIIYPQLIERPVIVFGENAVIACPLEKKNKFIVLTKF